MAVDTQRKRAAAATVGAPINAPSIVPDSSLTSFDRYQISWAYRSAALGTILFFNTEVSDVTDNWNGVTVDSGGNINASGTVYEGGIAV